MEYRRSQDITWEVVDDRAVILDAEGSTLTTLNPVGTLIWHELASPRAVADITDALRERFPDVERAQVEDDARAFLAELVADGLVTAG